MGKHRRGNYVFVSWIGDHGNHVHVYKDGRLLVKWNIDAWCEEPGSGKASSQIKRLLRELKDEGKIGYAH